MKKIVRLTESDLIRLVKRVINEQKSMDPTNTAGQKTSSRSGYDITQYIDKTGNSGCGMPFLIEGGSVVPKFGRDELVIVTDERTGLSRMGYKVPREKVTSFGSIHQGSSIGSCTWNDMVENRRGFVNSQVYRALTQNPGQMLPITFNI